MKRPRSSAGITRPGSPGDGVSEARSRWTESIERFGEPRLVVEGGRLRLRTSVLGAVQALYAVAEEGDGRRPVAAALFTRTSPDTMTLLHIAVDADFASDGSRGSAMLTLRLLNEVTRACSRIKGIRRISLLYGSREIRIQRPHDP